MKMEEKIKNKLREIIPFVDEHEIPTSAWDYIEHRKRLLRNIRLRAEDTAFKHGGWVFYCHTIEEETEIVDNLTWEFIYDGLKESTGLSIGVLNALSLSLSIDPAAPKIKCKDIKEVFGFKLEDGKELITPEAVIVAFEGIDNNWWTEEEVKMFFDENETAIPLFDIDEYSKHMKDMFGGMVDDDFQSLPVNQEGDDVSLA
tara:strand:- start:41 stop:643 length:603 start_codon:yes stop_codon:yes gene_type:complete